MQKPKVGLIGCGYRAREAYFPVIMEAQKGGLLEFVSVCDKVEKVSKEIGENYHVRHYESVEKMLEKEKKEQFKEPTELEKIERRRRSIAGYVGMSHC